MDREKYCEVINESNSIQERLRIIMKAIQQSTEISNSEASVINAKLKSIEVILSSVQNSLNARDMDK